MGGFPEAKNPHHAIHKAEYQRLTTEEAIMAEAKDSARKYDRFVESLREHPYVWGAIAAPVGLALLERIFGLPDGVSTEVSHGVSSGVGGALAGFGMGVESGKGVFAKLAMAAGGAFGAAAGVHQIEKVVEGHGFIGSAVGGLDDAAMAAARPIYEKMKPVFIKAKPAAQSLKAFVGKTIHGGNNNAVSPPQAPAPQTEGPASGPVGS